MGCHYIQIYVMFLYAILPQMGFLCQYAVSIYAVVIPKDSTLKRQDHSKGLQALKKGVAAGVAAGWIFVWFF